LPEQGRSIPVTLSIGVSVPLEDADTIDGLIEVADKRLYAAKHAGRDRVCLEG
jgi:PleD family two-component response regulator